MTTFCDVGYVRSWSQEDLRSGKNPRATRPFRPIERIGPWSFVLVRSLLLPRRRVKNGLELVREIRVINRSQRLAIHTSERGLKAPCAVLLKPYKIGKLLRLLREPVTSLALPLE